MKAIALAIVSALLVQQPPTFRTGTDVVEVDVVVHDKNGVFVSDLSADDFIVEDNGRPQSVDQIYLHLLSTPQGRDATSSDRFVPTAERGGSHRTIVVVFDSDHLSTSGFKRTKDAALTLFEKQFLDGVDMGGIVVDGRIVNNRLTSVREELVKAIKNATPSTTKSSRVMEERQFPRMSEIEAVRIRVNNDRSLRDEVIRRALEEDPNMRADMVESMVDVKSMDMATSTQAITSRTVQVLKALMSGLERIEGRKTVVLLTEGFIAEESWPLVRDAVTFAARANTRIYTLDARGLDRGLRSVFDVAPGSQDANLHMLQQMDFGGDAMNSLAVDTGGFVVRNTNDFARAIERIADDSGNYYVLGYRSTTPQDGKFHSLTVKSKRPGLAVRARRGYLATPRPAVAITEAERRPDESRPGLQARQADARASTDAEPTPAPIAPAGAEPVVTGVLQAQGLRLRPDAGKHVELLLKDARADEAARAGWEAYQRGDVATARASLGAAAAAPHPEPWIKYALGMSEYALKEYRESAGAWEDVRLAAPEFEPVYFDLVDSYLQLKDHDQALKILRSARERWPRDPDVFNAMGVVQTSRGAMDDAVKSFQQAVALAPQDETGYFNLGRALELRYVRSRRYVQQLRTWVSNEHDRTDAIENYRRCISIGGPFIEQAQAGLTRLNWMSTPKS
ncbi:MAG TPA: VWA domain-containing protein [Vicinamibacterales bacterium]|nr:VWA domain-containing protein [Vicinamibacterales bacterium]